MDFSHYKAGFGPKKKHEFEILAISFKKYDVVERLPEDASGEYMPIIVKRHQFDNGYQIYEQRTGKMSKQIFDSVQRLNGTVFYVTEKGKDYVYIASVDGPIYLSVNNYNFLVGKSDEVQRLLETTPYKKYVNGNPLGKQPGSED